MDKKDLNADKDEKMPAADENAVDAPINDNKSDSSEKGKIEPEIVCKKKNPKRIIASVAFYLILIPAVVLIGFFLFNDKKYNLVSLAIAFLTCVPFFIRFERKKTGVRELVVIAVMTAISVVGRLIFAPLPFFKPVTAVVIITAIAFGGDAGFIVGSFTAIVSNIYFGQGPWTPFQMLSWGLIGFITGLVTSKSKKVGPVFLILSGVIGGAGFSLLMDVWTTLSATGTFLWGSYLVYITSALPMTITYMYSNVAFLLVLTQPILGKLNRVKTKYGLFPERNTVVCTLSEIVKKIFAKFRRKR